MVGVCKSTAVVSSMLFGNHWRCGRWSFEFGLWLRPAQLLARPVLAGRRAPSHSPEGVGQLAGWPRARIGEGIAGCHLGGHRSLCGIFSCGSGAAAGLYPLVLDSIQRISASFRLLVRRSLWSIEA